MSLQSSIVVVALPLVSAAVLAVVGSPRVGSWINVGSAGLQLVVAATLSWHAEAPAAHLALLTAFVALTTSWFGWRDSATLSLARRSLRQHHAGFQAFVAATQLALLATDWVLAWCTLVLAVAAAGWLVASRLVLLCGIGLLLALLGMLLLDPAPELAGVLLVVGYGALAGLVPLHGWLADAATESVPPAAIIVTTLLPNVPLLLFARLDIAPEWLMAAGLLSLLLGGGGALLRGDARRRVAFAGMAQVGLVVFAFGLGEPLAAWLLLTLLALLRAAALQSPSGDPAAGFALVLLPLYGLLLLAGPAVALTPWLLLPLAAGVLMASTALLPRRPVRQAADWMAMAPVWLQLGLAAVLALAMPEPLRDWFQMVAG